MTDESPKEPSMYEQLVAIDVIDPIVHLLVQGAMRASIADYEAGKPCFHMIQHVGIHRMWTFVKMDQERKCAKWFEIYYKYYKILPPPCLKCWKVVYAPQSVVELIEFQKFQANLGAPGKCGVEGRDYTDAKGGYRAFWYCPYDKGLKVARVHYERIKKALSDHFGKDLIQKREEAGLLFLKRGCTEFERDFGPSDQWDKIDHTRKFKLLESVWADPEEQEKEFAPLVYTNYKRWIEIAKAHGDPTAGQYMPSGKVGGHAVKYHCSDHKDEDFECSMSSLNETMEDNDGSTVSDKEGTGKEEGLFELELD